MSRTLYIDADTGEQVSDLGDYGDYEVVNQEDGFQFGDEQANLPDIREPEPEYDGNIFGSPLRIGKRVVSQLGDSLSGGLTAAEDAAIGLEKLFGIQEDPSYRTGLDQSVKRSSRDLLAGVEKQNISPYLDLFEKGAAGVAAPAALIASGAGLPATLAGLGGLGITSKYGELRDEGASPGTALGYSTANELAQQAINIPTLGIFGSSLKPVMKGLAGAGYGYLSAPAGVAADTAATYGATGQAPTEEEYAARQREAANVGAVSNLLFPLAEMGGRAAKRRVKSVLDGRAESRAVSDAAARESARLEHINGLDELSSIYGGESITNGPSLDSIIPRTELVRRSQQKGTLPTEDVRIGLQEDLTGNARARDAEVATTEDLLRSEQRGLQQDLLADRSTRQQGASNLDEDIRATLIGQREDINTNSKLVAARRAEKQNIKPLLAEERAELQQNFAIRRQMEEARQQQDQQLLRENAEEIELAEGAANARLVEAQDTMTQLLSKEDFVSQATHPWLFDLEQTRRYYNQQRINFEESGSRFPTDYGSTVPGQKDGPSPPFVGVLEGTNLKIQEQLYQNAPKTGEFVLSVPTEEFGPGRGARVAKLSIKKGEIEHMVVSPELQRQGIMQKLLKYAESRLGFVPTLPKQRVQKDAASVYYNTFLSKEAKSPLIGDRVIERVPAQDSTGKISEAVAKAKPGDPEAQAETAPDPMQIITEQTVLPLEGRTGRAAETPPAKVASSEATGEPGAVIPKSVRASRLRKRLGSEKGATTLVHDAIKAIDDLFSGNGMKDVEDGLAKVTERDLTKSAKFLGGDIAGREIKAASFGLGAARKLAIFPKTVAEKLPKFAPVYESAKWFFRRRTQFAAQLGAHLKPYYDLADPTRVKSYLERASDDPKSYPNTPENMTAHGLTPPEALAVRSVRETMDMSLDMYKQALLIKYPDKAAQIEEHVTSLKAENYIPRARFGNKYIAAWKDGELKYYSLHESGKDLKRTLTEVRKMPGVSIETGRVGKAAESLYDNLPPEVLSKLAMLDPDAAATLASMGLKPEGFSSHVLHAKKIPGYTQDFGRAFADYTTSVSGYAARKIAEVKFDDAIKQINPNKGPNGEGALYDYATNYRDYVLSNGAENAGFRQFLALYYLGGNAKSALVNMTQTMTTTLPQAIGLDPKGGARTWAGAMGKTFQYFKSREAFQKANPELAKAIKTALEEGIVDAGQFRELVGRGKGNASAGKKHWTDTAMFMFDAAERHNRVQAMITGFELATKRGLKGEERQSFAEKFVDDTQFIYDRSNRPQMARGKLGAPLFTFRLFAGNYLRFLRNNATKEQWPAIATSLAAMTAFGGVAALPFAKIVENFLEKEGFEPKKLIRQAIADPAVADTIIYGLPKRIGDLFGLPGQGFSISGAVGLGDTPPAETVNSIDAGLQFALGVPYDLLGSRPKKAYNSLTQEGDPIKAVEQLLPEALRNASVAIRAGTRGAFRNASNEPLVEDPSMLELIGKGVGVTPGRLAIAYEKAHSRQVIKNRGEEARGRYNFLLAKALFDEDDAGFDSIIDEISAQNERAKTPEEVFTPNKQSIKEFYSRMINPDAARIKRAPKNQRQSLQELDELYAE